MNILIYIQLAQHLQSLVTKWQCTLHLLLVLLKTARNGLSLFYGRLAHC
jgi:hypothetical protein